MLLPQMGDFLFSDGDIPQCDVDMNRDFLERRLSYVFGRPGSVPEGPYFQE